MDSTTQDKMTLLRMTVLTVGLALGGIACGSSEAGAPNTSPVITGAPAITAPPTTAAPAATIATTTSMVPAFGSADAFEVADRYFAAYNAGDVEAVIGLFESDATFRDNSGSMSRSAWERRLLWNAAQGTTLSPPACRLNEEIPGDSVTLTCSHDHRDALILAVDAEPVPIKLTLDVAPGGIRDWTWIFGDPPFKHVGRPFIVWVAVNHPDHVDAVGFEKWSTAEEAEQNGLLTAQYAAEWATYLKENSCVYDEPC